MPMDLQHRIRYIIRLTEPVDLFDVIYKLKIATRIDFNATTTQIVLTDYIPNKSDSEFFQTYSNIWNSSSNYFSFKNISNLDPSDVEEKFKNQYEFINMRKSYDNHSISSTEITDPPIDSFENYYGFWQTIFTKLDEFFASKTLDPESEKVLEAIMQTPELKDNIKSIGWEDYWLTC
jgi:hypothetical protein